MIRVLKISRYIFCKKITKIQNKTKQEKTIGDESALKKKMTNKITFNPKMLFAFVNVAAEISAKYWNTIKLQEKRICLKEFSFQRYVESIYKEKSPSPKYLLSYIFLPLGNQNQLEFSSTFSRHRWHTSDWHFRQIMPIYIQSVKEKRSFTSFSKLFCSYNSMVNSTAFNFFYKFRFVIRSSVNGRHVSHM